MKTLTFKINGMMCQGCAKRAKEALLKIDGVVSVEIDLSSKVATISSNKEINENEITRILKLLGFSYSK